MGVSPIGSLPFNSPTIFHFHELKGVAVWQEKITSTITTVDGVKKSVEVGSFSHLCTTVLSIYIYIHPTWLQRRITLNHLPSMAAWSRKQQRNESRRFLGFSQLRVGIPNATLLRFLLQVLQDRLRNFLTKKMAGDL